MTALYKSRELGYGRWHSFDYGFDLRLEDSTRAATILPFWFTDQNKGGAGDASAVYVNPMSENFSGRDTGASIYPDSKVYKYYLRTMVSIPSAADAETDHVFYRAMQLCTSFDDVDKDTEDGSESIGSILRLQKETTNEDTVHPIWNATNLGNSISTYHPQDITGLTAGALQGVNADFDKFEQFRYQSDLSGMLKKNASRPRNYSVFSDRPWAADGWVESKPSVTSGNKGTFCGLYVEVPQVDGPDQMLFAGDTTTINHVRFRFHLGFTEYNKNFTQDL